jgi:GNAT superfamily N-acetyltransferase
VNIVELDPSANTAAIHELLAALATAPAPDELPETTPAGAGDTSFSLGFADGDEILGRIVGVFDGLGILRVKWFAVTESARGRGVGGRLLREVEQRAVTSGCALSIIETFSFSAPVFYEKQGYSVLGAVEDFPVAGEAFISFVKRLPA